jgi:uncharacterized protein DUF5671
MKTVRRLYFYLVASISLEVVLWGLISLLRSIADETVGGGAEALARALALIVVGVPIFLVHWLWAQNASARDEEERTAALRAAFLYSVLFGTLVPVVQNLLALIDRTFISVMRLDTGRAILGGSQTWPDNLIAILANGIVAFYFWNVLRREWIALPDRENFAVIRRFHRYLWLVYSLLMVIFGAQQLLRFLFYVSSDVFGSIGRETMINGLALLAVGTPIWFFIWSIIQNSLTDPSEKDSNLRLGVLYLLALSGVITVLTGVALVVQVVLGKLLGADISAADFLDQISGPVSVGLPLGAVWAYYGHWLNRHIEAINDPVRQAGMKRLYFYVLSALGLAGTLIGIAALISFVIDLVTGNTLTLDDNLRAALSTALSLIVAWLPLWWRTWQVLQAEALAQNDAGDHARRSIVRRTYLYLALFAGVIGGMVSAVALVFQLLKAVLTGEIDGSFVSSLLDNLQMLVLFAIVLVYHLLTLRRDGVSMADASAERQGDFKVLVMDSGDGFGNVIGAALAKYAPKVPVTVAIEKPEGQFQALILSGSLAVNAPEWVRSFGGSRIIVPNEAKGLIWAGGINKAATLQAAQAVRQLAEGQELRQQQVGSNSAWMILVYIAAALFGLELLLVAFGLLASTFVD